MHDDRNIGDADDTPAEQHDEHRNGCFAGTAHQTCHAVRECEQEVKQCDGACLTRAECYDLRVAVEKRNQRRDRYVNDDSDELGERYPAENAETRAFFCAFIFFCSEVLADKCRKSHREAGDRKKAESLDFCVGSAACDCHLSERVDIRLDKYICKRDHGVLQSARKTVADDLPEHERINADTPE